MQDKPDAALLLRALELFLKEQAAPQLEGHAAFQARIAQNVLAILAREARLARGFADAQKARLRELLGQDGDLLALNQELCARIRKGEIGLDNPQLRAHLKKAAMGKIAIDQPRYASYARARELGWEDEDGAL